MRSVSNPQVTNNFLRELEQNKIPLLELMLSRKRKVADSLEKAIVRNRESDILLRKQFSVSWRLVLDYFQNRPFILASDHETRLVITWTDMETMVRDDKGLVETHYTLKPHVTGHVNREFWHGIYSFIHANFTVVAGLISFETGQDHQPYIKFYSSQIDSSLMLKLLIHWKEVLAETVVTGNYLLTVIRLNKVL